MVVPTVDRGLRMLFFWRMAIAGQMPSMRVDVGLLHPLEELPRVGRQRLDVAALPFGVDRVEGERRLSRPADARHDDQRRGGSVRSMFLRLCVRAPRTTMWPRRVSSCARHLRCRSSGAGPAGLPHSPASTVPGPPGPRTVRYFGNPEQSIVAQAPIPSTSAASICAILLGLCRCGRQAG